MVDMDTLRSLRALPGRRQVNGMNAILDHLKDVMASLAAAISLLERSPKTAAPSNKMFDLMLDDYRASLDRAREALKEHFS